MSSKGDPELFKYYQKSAPEAQAVYQYYVVELQKYDNGEFGHIVHFAYDANQDIARRKGDSKYYETLAAAALSGIPEHAAVLVASNCFPLNNWCYEPVVTANA